MKKKEAFYFLGIVVFICGAALMALELVASRLMAPHLGATYYIWTSIIGIIMFSLSAGYWLGGIIADKKASYNLLSIIVLLASLFTILIYFVENSTLIFLARSISDLRLASIVASLILFFIPSLILGMVSPYAAKLALSDMTNSGKTVGNLYAVSTFGSIAGTFAAGFYLIPTFGCRQIIIIIAASLVFCSLFVSTKDLKLKIGTAVIIGVALILGSSRFAFAHVGTVTDEDSLYNRIIVTDMIDKDGEPVRHLVTEEGLSQSGIYLNKPDLLADYTKYYELSASLSANRNILMIGGGGNVYPTYHHRVYNDSSIDVVEIDSKMITISKQYFRFQEDSKLKVINEDGRIFLNNNPKKYDAILIDAFKSYSPPFQLTTKESMQKAADSLNNDGVLIANIVSSMEGSNSKLICSQYKTLQTIFPQLMLYQVNKERAKTEVQNFVFVATKDSHAPELIDKYSENLVDNQYLKNVCSNVQVLVDNFAPTEMMIKK